MSEVQRQIRQRQHMETLCATTLRALSGKRQLQYHGRRLYIGDSPLARVAPHLRVHDSDNLSAYRGVADGVAVRLLYSDARLHAELAPESPMASLLFDWLEQLRVESLAPSCLPGVQNNLIRRFTDWSLAFVSERYTEGVSGELVYTVIQVCWSRLMGRPVLEETEGLTEVRRGKIVAEIGTALDGIRQQRKDQAAFAQHALAIAEFVAGQITNLEAENDMPEQEDDRRAFSVLLDFEDEGDHSFATALSGNSTVLDQIHQHYRVFTSAYDIEKPVSRLVRKAQLMRFRGQLDTEIEQLQVNPHRLARYFQVRLSIPERSGWRFGEEFGHIDGRRLSQIVASPTERRIFQLEKNEMQANTIISLLLDCSGSMKVHSEFLALIIDRTITALTMAGVPTEILGFTTGAWNGGRARQDWIRAGQPDYPGRLNESCHLVFKSANEPWRRARHNLGALLRHDLYREGLDGEAVDWACERLLTRPESRHILVVLSDGCPVDTATQRANDRYYLDNHLKQVVARRELEGAIEIRGLGVGLDLNPFYRHSLIVDPHASIDNRLLGEIATLIAEPELCLP